MAQAARRAACVVSSQFCSAAVKMMSRMMTSACKKDSTQPAVVKTSGVEQSISQSHQSRAAMNQGCCAQRVVLVRAISNRNSRSVHAIRISASTQACSRPSGTSIAVMRASVRSLSLGMVGDDALVISDPLVCHALAGEMR
jgi:hypothetical protein